jgi:hypothetical protein
MGASGSHGPKPYEQHQASTVFLRVPTSEWVPITRGAKTEFRASPRAVTQALNLKTPTPVVAYRVVPGRPKGQTHDAVLMMLEETWQEPLLAISEESLEREGHASVAHFRRYWMSRTGKRFTPTRMVRVFRVRPWQEGDWQASGELMMKRLYGEFREAKPD